MTHERRFCDCQSHDPLTCQMSRLNTSRFNAMLYGPCDCICHRVAVGQVKQVNRAVAAAQAVKARKARPA